MLLRHLFFYSYSFYSEKNAYLYRILINNNYNYDKN
jgi:hypothetical protein